MLKITPGSACARVDPHNLNQVAYTQSNDIHLFDKRSAQTDSQVFLAHEDNCLSLAFNPNKLHTIATCGADSMTRFWDLRKTNSCLLQFEDLSHWTTCLAYNNFHDQLLLTGGTSTFAHLYRAQSASSMLSQQADLETTFNMSSFDLTSERSFKSKGENGVDKMIVRVELEDSVVAVDWS